MKLFGIAIKSPQFIFLLILAANFATATSVFSQSGGGSGKGRIRSTGSHISLVRDVAKISYPKLDKAMAKTARPKSVLLIEPRRFDKEGFYIWRNPEGIWQLRVVSERPFSVLGDAKTDVKLEVVDKSVQIAHLDVKDAKELRFEGLVRGSKLEESRLIQFKVAGDFIEFDFLIDGQRNPENIYMGASGVRPAHIPFRLENKPVVPILPGSPQVRRHPAGQPGESQMSSGSGGGSGGNSD